MIGDVIILDPLNDSTIATFKPNLYLLNLLIKKMLGQVKNSEFQSVRALKTSTETDNYIENNEFQI